MLIFKYNCVEMKKIVPHELINRKQKNEDFQSSCVKLAADEFAENFASPLWKWIGQRRFVTNMQNWRISNYPGGIGFSFRCYPGKMALKVLLKIYREDGSAEFFLADAYKTEGMEGDRQKWQTHQLPLFPYESCHGCITHIAFSYLIHKDGKSLHSRYNYKFAGLDDFQRGRTESDDFDDQFFKTENYYTTTELAQKDIQKALDNINRRRKGLPIRPFFTRGNTWAPDHPVHEIHRLIDKVIERKKQDPEGRHFISIAFFDFDNQHVAEHLVYAWQNGVDIDCFADWAAVSSMNCTENVAKMRRAGIPICGVVRNTPCDPSGGIASMHTKIIVFDGEVVHSSSYNLHFHLWGGNWENALFYDSRDFALLYLNIYHAIRGGVVQGLRVKPESRYNLYYSFGSYYISNSRRSRTKKYFRPQDAIITEIINAKDSIVVCMFDMDHLTGIPLCGDNEADVVSALIAARDRGVNVKIIMNGMITHTGALPQAWDKGFKRPLKGPVRRLKDAWMELVFVYYHESIYSPLHHKFAVFDNLTVMTESYNWYTASVYSDETLSVIRDPDIAAAFLAEADKICGSFRLGCE